MTFILLFIFSRADPTCKSLIPKPSGSYPDITGLLGAPGLYHCSTTGHGSRRRHFTPDDVSESVRAGADCGGLCAAIPSSDGRPLRENPNRLQHYYQFQVIIKPSPDNIQELYLGSLKELGIDPTVHDIRFVEDNWENPTLGAWGLGWEVWLNGMEVTQFTYFQQVGGLECKPVTGKSLTVLSAWRCTSGRGQCLRSGLV